MRPNIVVITSHDTGRHLGCYGVKEVRSPCIDALAGQGVRMDNYFATVPIGCPSRASMMTGRYPQSHGLMDLCFPPFDWEMHENERHLSHLLRDAGNTVLVYTTDHGIEFPRAKWTLYDPGIGIAMIVRWPEGGVEGGRICGRLQSNVDFLPTVLDLAGLPIPQNIEGRSFAGALTGGVEPPERREIHALFSKRFQGRCVRTRDFKLIRNFDTDRYFNRPVEFTAYAGYGVTPNLELYDLRADPDEFNNLAIDPSHSDVRRELGGRLLRWLKEVGDPILRGPLRTPFYERSLLELQADGGEAVGTK